MKEFLKTVDWKKFGKIMLVMTAFLIFSASDHVKWYTIVAIDVLFGSILFMRGYIEYSMIPKPTPTLKELRKRKLKKICQK